MAENPFDYTRPLEPALFIGRWTLVDQIVADLSTARAKSGAVIGGRRFGKSSVLEAIASRLARRLSSTVRGDRHILPLIVDIKGCERKNTKNIYACIIQALYDDLQPYQALTIAPSSATLEAVMARESDMLSFSQFKKFLNQLATQFDEEYGPLRVVLLLDEVEATTSFEWCEDLFNQLRSLIYSGRLADTISLVLTGSSRVIQVRERGSPLLNMLTLRQLEPFSTADLKELMARGGEMPDQAAAAVQAASGGHPFIAQYLLHHLWDPSHGFEQVTPQQVEKIARQMRSKRYPDFQGWWQAIGENGQKAYTLLVSHEEWVEEAAIIREIGDVKEGLSALCYHGLAVRDSSWQRYRYVGTLFREWFFQIGHEPVIGPNQMLRFQERAKLVEYLLAIPSIADRASRATVISQLPAELKTNVAYSEVDKTHVFNIVKTCLQYPSGMQNLSEILQFFEGASISMQQFKEAIGS